jgi:hypothetical protein
MVDIFMHRQISKHNKEENIIKTKISRNNQIQGKREQHNREKGEASATIQKG